MRDRLIGMVCAVLLAALTSFYANQIWLSSERTHTPTDYSRYTHTNKEAKDIPASEDPNDRIATYTLWLAIFNGLLVVVAGFQVRLLILADRTARFQATQLKQASDSAETQNAIIARQTDIQEKQHEVGRLQFLATHRPRLKIRHVNIVAPLHIGNMTLFFNHGAEITGGLVVVNVGGSKATIVDTRYRMFSSKTGLPALAPYDTDFRTNLLFPPTQRD